MSEICLYPPERLAALARRERRGWAMVALSAAAGLLLCGAGALLRRSELCVVGLVAGAWAAYYGADAWLRPVRLESAFARHMVGGTAHGFDGKWQSEDFSIVYVEGVRARSVYCEFDGAQRIFYVRDGDVLPPVAPGAAVHIDAVDRFILRIAVPERLWAEEQIS